MDLLCFNLIISYWLLCQMAAFKELYGSQELYGSLMFQNLLEQDSFQNLLEQDWSRPSVATCINDNYEGRTTFYNVFADNDHARCTIMIQL